MVWIWSIRDLSTSAATSWRFNIVGCEAVAIWCLIGKIGRSDSARGGLIVLKLWRSYWQGCCWTSYTEGHFDIPKLAVEEIQEKHIFCRVSSSIVREIHSQIKKSHSSSADNLLAESGPSKPRRVHCFQPQTQSVTSNNNIEAYCGVFI